MKVKAYTHKNTHKGKSVRERICARAARASNKSIDEERKLNANNINRIVMTTNNKTDRIQSEWMAFVGIRRSVPNGMERRKRVKNVEENRKNWREKPTRICVCSTSSHTQKHTWKPKPLINIRLYVPVRQGKGSGKSIEKLGWHSDVVVMSRYDTLSSTSFNYVTITNLEQSNFISSFWTRINVHTMW